MPPRLPSIYTSSLSLPSSASSALPYQCSRNFSSTPKAFRRRRRLESEAGKKYGFFNWLETGLGAQLRRPLFEEPNYMHRVNAIGERYTPTDQPFPLNAYFKAHPVLSSELREEVWKRVIVERRGVRRVSADFGLELERVAACARLGEIENMWKIQNKPRATELTKSLHSMMPTTPLQKGLASGQGQPFHETITDLAIHPDTHTHLFLPVAESTVFNRDSAAKVLGLLPSHIRMPHSELVEVEQARANRASYKDQLLLEQEREKLATKRAKERQEARRKRTASSQIVESPRWQFRLKQVRAGEIGFRYGVPHEDRKRGQIKIPTRVL